MLRCRSQGEVGRHDGARALAREGENAIRLRRDRPRRGRPPPNRCQLPLARPDAAPLSRVRGRQADPTGRLERHRASVTAGTGLPAPRSCDLRRHSIYLARAREEDNPSSPGQTGPGVTSLVESPDTAPGEVIARSPTGRPIAPFAARRKRRPWEMPPGASDDRRCGVRFRSGGYEVRVEPGRRASSLSRARKATPSVFGRVGRARATAGAGTLWVRRRLHHVARAPRRARGGPVVVVGAAPPPYISPRAREKGMAPVLPEERPARVFPRVPGALGCLARHAIYSVRSRGGRRTGSPRARPERLPGKGRQPGLWLLPPS